MYIKARWNKRDFAGSSRPCCGREKKGPCFAVWAVVCDPSPRAECVPAFGVKANVGHLCEKLKSGMKSGWEIKFMAEALSDFFSSADSGFTENREMYVYKSMTK